MRRLVASPMIMVASGCFDSKNGHDAGGDEGGECSGFEPCAGDITASWEVQDMCVTQFASLLGSVIDEPACSDLLRGVDARPMGTLVVNADGSGSLSGTFALDLQIALTESCVVAIGTTQLGNAECSAFERGISEPDLDNIVEGGACELEGGVCNCLVASRAQEFGGSGTLEVRGNQLFDGSNSDDFCIEGDTLQIWSMDSGHSGLMTLTRL